MWVNTNEFSLSLNISDNVVVVTSAAVPAVVGTAMIGTQGFVVGATPSRLLTSSNSGFAMMIPIALEVSIEEPPPIATM